MKYYTLKTFGMAVALLLMAGTAKSADFKWSALNPAFEGAEYVNDAKMCYGCHKDLKDTFEHTTHAKVFQSPKGAPAAGVCESCHGPRSLHIESPDKELALNPEQRSKVCLQCHQDSGRMNWETGKHKANEIFCDSCHNVMEKKSDKGLLKNAKQPDLCYTCHTDVKSQLNKSSHHPVREGKLKCSDCHNPHGSVTQSMLKGVSVNETCFTCHQDKRGPYVWVHPPALENCLTCHNSHGSNNRKLLTGKDSFLCLECHTYGGHVNGIRYNRVSGSYGEGCVNCHMAIHGSNSPSGAKLTR